MEVYFETPSDGVSQLWPGGSNPAWHHSTTFPNAAALYKTLFRDGTRTARRFPAQKR